LTIEIQEKKIHTNNDEFYKVLKSDLFKASVAAKQDYVVDKLTVGKASSFYFSN